MTETLRELMDEGYAARRSGDAAHSRQVFLDVVRKASEAGDESALAEAFCGLAQAETDIGAFEAAKHQYENATVLYRRIGPMARVAYALRHEADTLRRLEKYGGALPLYGEAEGIYREMGASCSLDLANTLRGMALAAEALGDREKAVAGWREARGVYKRVGVMEGVEEGDRRIAEMGERE